MDNQEQRKALLKRLPGIDKILGLAEGNPKLNDIPRTVLVRSIRLAVENLRHEILENASDIPADDISGEAILQDSVKIAFDLLQPNLKPVINATGVVVHTNFGRSLLSTAAIENICNIANQYSNLEFDLLEGKRGSRYVSVEDLLCEISGAEAALAVNNNAAAVLLCLNSLATDKKVIVSRGELVEIGGSFRIPDIMTKSGGILSEVGTTNRTHPADYERAIDDQTALLLKVHASNYSIVGFTAEVSPGELVALGKRYHLPVMIDLGSGTFIDFSRFGLTKEPTVQESIASGADIITFSGDKLLGGPQAGIIVGKKELLDSIKRNPLTRAVRIDKLTLAALESTLRVYRDESEAINSIPTLRMLTCSHNSLFERAEDLSRRLAGIDTDRIKPQIIDGFSKVGGGALPAEDLPTKCVGIQIKGISANEIDTFMRAASPPVIGRIEDGIFIMDLRTIEPRQLPVIESVFNQLMESV